MPTAPTEWEPEPSEQTAPTRREIAMVGCCIPERNYTGDGAIYCRVQSSKGEQFGSEDLFDGSHLVTYTTGAGYLFLSYPLSSIGSLPAGNYTFIFYDEQGRDFYLCSAYLNGT